MVVTVRNDAARVTVQGVTFKMGVEPRPRPAAAIQVRFLPLIYFFKFLYCINFNYIFIFNRFNFQFKFIQICIYNIIPKEFFISTFCICFFNTFL